MKRREVGTRDFAFINLDFLWCPPEIQINLHVDKPCHLLLTGLHIVFFVIFKSFYYNLLPYSNIYMVSLLYKQNRFQIL